MPEPVVLTASQPPSGTAALDCCRERLAATEQRLAALAAACLRPCGRLLADLDRMPAAARFEPFPAEPATPVGASGHEQPARRGRRAAPPSHPASTAAADAVTSQAPAAKAAAPGPQAAPAPAGGRESRPRPTTAAPTVSRPGGRSYGTEPSFIASLGDAVAALLARWPEAPGVTPARPTAPAAPGAASLADTPLGPIIQNLVSQSTGRPGTRQSAPARQFARLPTQLGMSAAAIAEWMASQAPAPAGRPGGLAAALAGQAPSLLAQLVAGLDPADAKAHDPAPPAAPRQPAPRARSRLNEAASPEAGARPATEAPAGNPSSGQEAGDLVQQLNRLLLDQAWLRGVDLT